MFRGKINGIRLAKDNTVRIPLSFSQLIGSEEIGIYGSTLESCLSLIPLTRHDKVDALLLGMCFGHYALSKKHSLYLPKKAQQFAGIEETTGLIIIGMIDYLELWSADIFSQNIQSVSSSEEDMRQSDPAHPGAEGLGGGNGRRRFRSLGQSRVGKLSIGADGRADAGDGWPGSYTTHPDD